MTNACPLRPGVRVVAHGRLYQISAVGDLETVLAVDIEHQTRHVLRIHELEQLVSADAAPDHADRMAPELSMLTDDDWRIAQARLAVIRPLLHTNQRTAAMVQHQAEQGGVHMVTVYRWLERYETTGQLSALLPGKRGGGRGQSRLTPEVNVLLQATIEEYYLTTQKRSVQATAEEVQRRCRHAGVSPPHLNTVRARIAQVSKQERLRRRGQGRQARDEYTPGHGAFPNAEWPLAMVQIDHTPGDIILVDDVQRLPIGRPWITVAIDVFSRMVAGFYVSLDAPSALSAGLCLAHAILPKDTWLAKHGIDTSWPVWGVMDVVHADNAKEFRGKMLQRACEQYSIDLHWRPVARPHFGGHIERLCGTLNHAIHTLPGTTFSTVQERGAYPAEQQAAMTLNEFEHWLAVRITQIYHQAHHTGIGMPPITKFEHGIFGDDHRPGRGLLPRPTDPERLRLDFMPYLERTVQPYGVKLDNILYYHDVLKPWIRASEPGPARTKRTFVIRRDPRDISTVYFHDPELNQYFALPYRRLDAPSMSLWELRAVRRKLKEEGAQAVDETALFAGYERLRAIEAQAVNATAKARRQAQRRRHHHAREPLHTANDAAPKVHPPLWDDDDEPITPFDDIQVGR
jgi:putative transposase